ncbi:molybdopterin molybdenumtransferase MoeA [Desulfosarcina ovata subsp. sediminis]|uniref:Molybdopterin molybdenumtransferase n=1 Tax=Desulfosarcina ovata subsp. sediminis TaxID=885957 RepID=A0A5K7ZPB2_9BACT|nr:gephyrin-like molybdotransferase Glp [Desulfosarcina ovata]BBO82377.1 molybdopterin molybdenumtransferase MoeA [Desulfosarcina ovata subsp. sediminis]
MINLSKAQQMILEAAPVLGRESVPILDSLRRVLAQDIVAIEDHPATDISAMDGYAVRFASLAGISDQTPVTLRIIGESPAGRPCGKIVGDGEAVRIMTGGLIPDGADTVVKIELTTETEGYVTCTGNPRRGIGIRFRGDSMKKGEVVLCAGDVVTPLGVGALASLRRAHVFVHRKPVVAIVSTGDELSDFHEPAIPGKTMSSNLYALSAQVLEAQAIPMSLGIVGDDIEAQRGLLAEALRADVIITSGGTSRGKYDLVHKAFASLGLETRYSNIFVKPGKPTIFGTIGKTLIFGLPGNPAAAMLSFDQFIRPTLFKMMGYPNGSDALLGQTNSLGQEGPFSHIDSFNKEMGGNKDHRRPSQVPLEKNRSGNRRQLPHSSETAEPDTPSEQLKLSAS